VKSCWIKRKEELEKFVLDICYYYGLVGSIFTIKRQVDYIITFDDKEDCKVNIVV